MLRGLSSVRSDPCRETHATPALYHCVRDPVRLLGIDLTAACFYATQTIDFGFKLPSQAAHTFVLRIEMIRLLGIAFAVSLMLLIVFTKSRAARAALGMRWILGAGTSAAFLLGIGMITLPGESGVAVITLSIIQLGIEGFAILILCGEDAATWFERRSVY